MWFSWPLDMVSFGLWQNREAHLSNEGLEQVGKWHKEAVRANEGKDSNGKWRRRSQNYTKDCTESMRMCSQWVLKIARSQESFLTFMKTNTGEASSFDSALLYGRRAGYVLLMKAVIQNSAAQMVPLLCKLWHASSKECFPIPVSVYMFCPVSLKQSYKSLTRRLLFQY